MVSQMQSWTERILSDIAVIRACTVVLLTDFADAGGAAGLQVRCIAVDLNSSD
jgi:hypothetical protein